MSVSGIRKLAGQVFGLGSALFAGLVFNTGNLQAQTPLEEFKKFLTNPPPIEEIVFERKLLIALPSPPGVTNMVPTGPFFQLRLQTNAYFLRQMDVIGEAPKNHRAGNLLEGERDDAFWEFNNNQLDLWPDKKQAKRKIEVERNIVSGPILSLGLSERINPSTIVWKGDTFTARGTGGSRFEGRIESQTAAGLPERIVTWAADNPDSRYCVDYKYRLSFHPWFPVAIKPFFENRVRGMPFLGTGTGRIQEFYVRSVKMGSVTSQENFFPTQFTNANTLTILHTKGGMEFFKGGRKLNLVHTRPPPPQTNNVAPSSAASPTNAPLPAAPPPNKAPSPPPSPPPSRILLIIAIACLSVPPLLLIFFTIRANKSGSQ